MAELDGSIHIGTAIDDSGLKKALASVESSLKDASKYFDTLGAAGKDAFKAIASQLGSVDAAAAVTGDKIGALAKKKEILNTEIQKLISSGLKPEDLQVKALKNVYDNLTDAQSANSASHVKVKKTAMDAFASMRDVMMGPVGVAKMLIGAFKQVSAAVDKMENEWAQAEQTMAILGATIKATGASSWTSSKQIQDFAKELQDLTGYADDSIVAMENILLGFKNIKGDNFKEASLQILNMSKVMGMDLTSAAQAVGKALDDPISGIDSLSRQGFKFSAQQKAMLKDMVETGKIAEAQKVILDELATTYGGAAEAANQTGTAVKQKLNLAIQDMNEEIGRSLSNSLAPFRLAFLDMAKAIGASMKAQNDFIDNMKKISNGTATSQEAVDGLTEKYNRLKETQRTSSGDPEIVKVIQLEIDETVALLNAMKSAQNYEARYAAAKKANDEAAAKQAEIDKKAAERQLAITTERIKATDDYKNAVKRANTQEGHGFASPEESSKAKINALEAEITALDEIMSKYGLIDDGIGATSVALRAAISDYNALASAIGDAARSQEELDAMAEENAKGVEGETDRRIKAITDAKKKALEDQVKLDEAADKKNVWKISGIVGTQKETVNEKTGEIEKGPVKGGTEVGNLLSGVSSIFEVIGSAMGGLVSSIAALANVQKILNPLQTIIDAMMSVLGPVINDLLAPLVGILEIVGKTIGAVLAPALQILQPVIEVISAMFIFLYNKVIRPVANFMIIAFNKIHNGFAYFINGILDMIDSMPFVDIGFRVGTVSETAGTLAEITTTTSKYTDAVDDANKELADNRRLFTSASKAGDAYNSVLAGVVKTVSSFYDGLKNVGSDLASTIIDSLTSGFDNDDFLYALEEYITKAVVQAAVFTDSFTSQISSIGAALATAIATGDTSAIAALRDQLALLYSSAAATAQAATEAVSGVFGSYAVGTMGLPSDGLIYAHQGEAVIPSGLMSEAASRGLTIAPTSSLLAGAGNVIVNLNAALSVDGRAMAGVVFKYQDELVGAAYGS